MSYSASNQQIEQLHYEGFYIIKNVLSSEMVSKLIQSLYSTYEKIRKSVGVERLQRANENGVVRLPMYFDPLFFNLLENPFVLGAIDQFLTPTSIMHLMNGFIMPQTPSDKKEDHIDSPYFQNRLHMDFPFVFNKTLVSINTFFALSDFHPENGGTLFVKGSQQSLTLPPDFKEKIVQPSIEAGTMIVFDSTLWHCAGLNKTPNDRLGINLQFTRPFFKQQLDYCRCLGEKIILDQVPRTQQLLGWNCRTPSSLDEFYQPEEKRFYKRRQF